MGDAYFGWQPLDALARNRAIQITGPRLSCRNLATSANELDRPQMPPKYGGKSAAIRATDGLPFQPLLARTTGKAMRARPRLHAHGQQREGTLPPYVTGCEKSGSVTLFKKARHRSAAGRVWSG